MHIKKYYYDIYITIFVGIIFTIYIFFLRENINMILLSLPFLILIFLLSVIAIPNDIIFRIRNILNKKLISKGRKLEIDVNNVFTKNMQSVRSHYFSNTFKGNTYTYFYYIGYWYDTTTKKSYSFRTHAFVIDAKNNLPLIKKTKVFIDEKNPKNYYVYN